MRIARMSSLIASSMLSVLAAASLQAADSQSAMVGIVTPAALDLRPPVITEIYTRAQIDQLLSMTFDDDIEEVRVEGVRPETIPARERMPIWQWILPMAPNRAKDTPVTLDALAYLPPAGVPDRDPVMFP